MSNFQRDREFETMKKIDVMLDLLPEFVDVFFIGIAQNTSTLTRLNYAYDLKIFFEYLINFKRSFDGVTMRKMKLSMLDEVTTVDIEKFLNHVSIYESDDKKVISNGEKGKARKLASMRSMYKYFFNKDMISTNAPSKVAVPKLHSKEIIRLEVDEVVKILNLIESGDGLTDKQKHFHKNRKLRDMAMVSLFLGTGIRISELVGINMNDIDFDQQAFTVTRKGGNRTTLYFSEEILPHLKRYAIYRRYCIMKNPDIEPFDREAFFVVDKTISEDKINNMNCVRISVRAVQNLVKKYAKIVNPLKNITPHKLRSTFGTNLYRETNDIYMVADVLGHKDVNTTKKHYAAISEDQRRLAVKSVKLRDDDIDDKN